MNTFKQHGYPAPTGFGGRHEWDAFISYVGFFKSSGDFRWEQTSRTFCIHLIQKGRGIFKSGRKKVEVKAGEMYAFFPGDHVSYYDFPDAPWEYIWMRFGGKNVEHAFSLSGITRKHPHLKIASSGRLATYIKEVVSSYSKGEGGGILPVAAAFNCLQMISGRTDSENVRDGGKSISDSFVSIIENQMDFNLSIKEISEIMKIDRTTLFRAFVKERGTSPKRYMEEIRLDKSASLLSNTRLSIKEIAEACGFSHPSHFGKVFRKRFGSSPVKWRTDKLKSV